MNIFLLWGFSFILKKDYVKEIVKIVQMQMQHIIPHPESIGKQI